MSAVEVGDVFVTERGTLLLVTRLSGAWINYTGRRIRPDDGAVVRAHFVPLDGGLSGRGTREAFDPYLSRAGRCVLGEVRYLGRAEDIQALN